MFATIARSGARRRRRRSITPRATVGANIRARHLQGFTGILQADAYSGSTRSTSRRASRAPITPALCWAHARRQFFELADIATNARRGKNAAAISPIALEAVKRIDALFDIERGINGQSAEEATARPQGKKRALLAELEAWLREQRYQLSRSSYVAEPIDYMLKRWDRFARFVGGRQDVPDEQRGRTCIARIRSGRKSWLFAGSDRGADRAAVMATLIVTAKLNDVDPQAWLADIFRRIAEIPQSRLHELLPWEWKAKAENAATTRAA